MTTQSLTSSVRGGAPSLSATSPEIAPLSPILDLPREMINIVSLKLREPIDVFNFLHSCKRFYNAELFEERVPELIETRIDALQNVESQKRAAAATQLAVRLGNRLCAIKLGRILDKIEIPDETDVMFLLHKEKKYAAACIWEKNFDQVLLEVANTELAAHEFMPSEDWINCFLTGVQESFAGNESLICCCYRGLWQWYSTNQESPDALVRNFALELLRAVAPAANTVKLSVLLTVLESARMTPEWLKTIALVKALHKVAQQLTAPEDKQSDRLFKALSNAFSGCSNQVILKNQLKIFCPLLAQKPGQHSKAGVAWLVQTIAQASMAGLTVEEIHALVPHDVFLEKGPSYIVNSAIEGNFSHEMLGVKETA